MIIKHKAMKEENSKKDNLLNWKNSLGSEKPGIAALILDAFISYVGMDGTLTKEDFKVHFCSREGIETAKDFDDSIGQMSNELTSDKEGKSHSVRPFKPLDGKWSRKQRYALHDDIKEILREIQWTSTERGQIEEKISPEMEVEMAVLEGGKKEKKTLVSERNYKLAQQAKERDHHTCRSCGFHYHNKIVEAHHLEPLSDYEKEEINTLDDLVTLCPNCHKIAHHFLKEDGDCKRCDLLLSKLESTRKNFY
ncbi:HNH endonuclease [Akkermansia muciniphila]|uniref:HNH endonuclease n=1 Tax=Akkermansia muciniphila TaxID=239935 RepID=UPI001BFF5B7E|nr:HNH endonuclease [Akkermansia muciniphila]